MTDLGLKLFPHVLAENIRYRHCCFMCGVNDKKSESILRNTSEYALIINKQYVDTY